MDAVTVSSTGEEREGGGVFQLTKGVGERALKSLVKQHRQLSKNAHSLEDLLLRFMLL